MTDDQPATVLLVDDDETVRLVMRLLLERAGYEVIQAPHGRAAVELVQERPAAVDVVLLDVMMPVMSGHEALPLLREAAPDLPVVFSSGYGESEVVEHLAEPTAYTSFIPKPSDVDALTAEIERALASRR